MKRWIADLRICSIVPQHVQTKVGDDDPRPIRLEAHAPDHVVILGGGWACTAAATSAPPRLLGVVSSGPAFSVYGKVLIKARTYPTPQAVYKPDSMSTDEFIVIVADESAAKKWVAGDKTIRLVDIVDSFDVFHTGQGSQGLLQRPSKQELDSVFGTHNDTEIVEIVLEKGKFVTGPAKTSAKEASASGIANQTSRGSVSGGR